MIVPEIIQSNQDLCIKEVALPICFQQRFSLSRLKVGRQKPDNDMTVSTFHFQSQGRIDVTLCHFLTAGIKVIEGE